MRLLDETEMRWIAGGFDSNCPDHPGEQCDGDHEEEDDIVVIGNPGNNWDDWNPYTDPWAYDPWVDYDDIPPFDPATMPAGPPPYQTEGASAAANQFAARNTSNENSNDENYKKFDKAAHDAYARFYDHATANPNAMLQIGKHQVAASAVLAAMESGHINITTSTNPSYIGNGGARTLHSSSGGTYIESTTHINPSHANMQTALTYGPFGLHTVIGHEIGHQVITALGLGSGFAEVDANVAGSAILGAIGMPMIAGAPGGYTYPPQ